MLKQLRRIVDIQNEIHFGSDDDAPHCLMRNCDDDDVHVPILLNQNFVRDVFL